MGPARRAMLDYVVTLTVAPWDTREEQIVAMRAQGFTDEAIAVVNLVTCFFAWCNRVVEGLGVPMEDSWPADVRHPRAGPRTGC